MSSMRALVKQKRGPGHMSVQDVPVPEPKAGEVLVDVRHCGVCGTDLKIRDDHFPYDPPVIVGHEFSGIIADVGSGAGAWTVGDRVVAEQHVGSCGRCEFCLTGRRQFCPEKRSPGYLSDGAFAEYIAVDSSLLHRVPDAVTLEQAALVEPMAIAANAILGRAGVHPEESVVILGTGPIALLALQMVRSAGAAFVATTGLDADEEVRFSIARDLGADACLNAERTDAAAAVREMTSGRGVDLVVDLSGAPPAIVSGFRMLKKNGRFCAIGLPGSEVVLPWSELVLNACTVHFSYSSDYIAWERCLSMLSERRVRTEGFTDNVFPLESWSEAFDSAASGRVLKAIVNPHPK